MAFKVWIDQDLCTGDGLCVEICEPLFYMHDDGLAYVKEFDDKTGLLPGTKVPRHKMGGEGGLVDIPDNLLNDCIDAAEECPGECIFIEEV